MGLETNIYPIENLEELMTSYKRYLVRGLRRDDPEYFRNRQELQRHVSVQLQEPALVLDSGGQQELVLPSTAAEPDVEYNLVHQQIHLEKIEENLKLSFADRHPDTDPILLRFLNFHIQEPLFHDPRFWQPRSGRGFYTRAASFTFKEIQAFRGFRFRAVLTPNGGIGLCFDVSTLYLARYPLDAYLSHNRFERDHKNQNVVYHYGYNWHEIKAAHLSDLTVSEYKVEGKPLLPFIVDELTQGNRKLPQQVAKIREDEAVVVYYDALGQERAAPASLCYPVHGTQHPEAAKNHRQTQMEPAVRRGFIHGMAKLIFDRLEFGGIRLRISRQPMLSSGNRFEFPKLRYGHERVLELRGADRDFGRKKLQCLTDPKAGFYSTDGMRDQLVILPKTVHRTFGQTFLEDLDKQVRALYPQAEYRPHVVEYDDQVKPTFVSLANSIKDAIDVQLDLHAIYGAALVMIPRLTKSKATNDELAAYVAEVLGKNDIHNVGIIHTTLLQESFEQPGHADGKYTVINDEHRQGRYRGYLRNVAINHILLTNYKWPFILADSVNADLIIGIDVKGHTVGISMASSTVDHFEYRLYEGKSKEKLSTPQAATLVKKSLMDVLPQLTDVPRRIVVQRDGRLFPSEVVGIESAISALQDIGELPAKLEVTFLEIAKSAPVSLRLFDVLTKDAKDYIGNPQLGTYFLVDEQSGYVCTTGEPLLRGMNGSVRPLFIRRVKGPMSIEACLQDTFALSCLTWTRPEGCMRDPITIRLLDRFLFDHATDYDEEGVNYAEFGEPKTYSLEEVVR